MDDTQQLIQSANKIIQHSRSWTNTALQTMKGISEIELYKWSERLFIADKKAQIAYRPVSVCSLSYKLHRIHCVARTYYIRYFDLECVNLCSECYVSNYNYITSPRGGRLYYRLYCSKNWDPRIYSSMILNCISHFYEYLD